jgi:hypothetical protein
MYIASLQLAPAALVCGLFSVWDCWLLHTLAVISSLSAALCRAAATGLGGQLCLCSIPRLPELLTQLPACFAKLMPLCQKPLLATASTANTC